MVRSAALALAALLASAAGAEASAGPDLDAFREERVVEILTRDPDGALRETNVWCVVLDGAVYVRTNDSRWLANIRRGSEVSLRARGEETAVRAEEEPDAERRARVEGVFKEKYGLLQRIMSALRVREPTVLRLTGS
jgi:hypothetical protein